MKSKINLTKDSSYRDLKALVPDKSDDHTPMGKTLIKSDERVLIRVKQDSATITVYESGWFAYQDDRGRITARAVSNCNTMYYPSVLGKVDTVKEDDFADLPFPLVLSHFGARNIADQVNKAYQYHNCISLNDEKVKLTEELKTPDFTVSLDLNGEELKKQNKKILADAMKALKPNQRTAVWMRFAEKKTYEQIAKVVGGDKTSAYRMIQRALKKLKKFF